LAHKWFIVGAALLAAIAAFIVSAFILSPQYQATSYVTITEPIIRAELDPAIQVSPSFPDTRALAELAEADAIVDQVAQELNLGVYFEEEDPELEAALQGQNQLRLRVTAADAGLAADIANAWAAIVVQRLNNLYGTGDQAIITLEGEVNRAREQWGDAQAKLEAYLPQSRVETLEVRLSDQKNALVRYLNKIENNQLLMDDIRALNSQLERYATDEKISIGNVLSIIAIQQRSVGGISGTQFQFQGSDVFGDTYTAAKVIQDLEVLHAALQKQNEFLQVEIEEIETRIGKLTVDLEVESHQLEQLTQERDLARSAYVALSNQLEETQIKINQQERSAKIVAEALVPQKVNKPRKIMITGFAFITALIASIGAVMVIDWWNIEDI
jgi:uncharacterized protein involved in exopolysaccharide biosynthesis